MTGIYVLVTLSRLAGCLISNMRSNTLQIKLPRVKIFTVQSTLISTSHHFSCQRDPAVGVQ